jgi:hypothetical protein
MLVSDRLLLLLLLQVSQNLGMSFTPSSYSLSPPSSYILLSVSVWIMAPRCPDIGLNCLGLQLTD